MADKINRESALVRSVLALDTFLSELERIGRKITSADLSGDFDVEYVQKLMSRFAECGEAISEEVPKLSQHLQEAQTRAQAVARGVSQQADLFNVRRNEYNRKLEEFRLLGDRVRELNAAIVRFRPANRDPLTDEHRAKLRADLAGFDVQLTGLIDELQDLRNSARDSRMKSLEKNAESLAQTLQAARKKLRDMP
jgi:hypothetical protein